MRRCARLSPSLIVLLILLLITPAVRAAIPSPPWGGHPWQGQPEDEEARYVNEAYGFSFTYPTTWTLREAPNFVQLRQGGLTLTIGYRNPDEVIDLLGVLPEGSRLTVLAVPFLADEVRRQVIVAEGRVKAVLYNVPGSAEIPAGGDEENPPLLYLGVRLDDVSVDVAAIDIPGEVQVEVDVIVASFAVSRTLEDILYQGWERYFNPTYGFSLRYPAESWVLREDDNSIRLRYEAFTLSIGFRRPDETIDLLGVLPAGVRDNRGLVPFLWDEEQTVTRQVILDQGHVRVVVYVLDGETELPAVVPRGRGEFETVLVLAIRLDDTRIGDPGLEIPAAVMAEVDQIVRSIRLVTTSAYAIQYQDWESVNNREYGFTLRYPEGWTPRESANLIRLRRDDLTLTIGYRTPDEALDLLGVLPDGQWEQRAVLEFQGNEEWPVARQVLLNEGRVRAVTYTYQGRPELPAMIWVERDVYETELLFTVRLDDTRMDVATIDIPEEVLVEADLIVASIRLWRASPYEVIYEGWEPYDNPENGFALRYPPEGWTLREDPNFVQLRQGGLTLTIGYRQPDEVIDLLGVLPDGRTETRAVFEFQGDEERRITRRVILAGERVRGVFYVEAGGGEIPGQVTVPGRQRQDPTLETTLLFAIRLDDTRMDVGNIDIPEETMAVADLIVSSIRVRDVR